MAEAYSPSVSGAAQWRVNCGSFAAHGHYGTANDYVLQMFISCSDGPRTPTRLKMGIQVYESWVLARRRAFVAALQHLATILDDPREWLGYVTGGGGNSEKEIIRLLQRVLALAEDDGRYTSQADVVADRELRGDVILFYRGDELLGECSGWIA